MSGKRVLLATLLMSMVESVPKGTSQISFPSWMTATCAPMTFFPPARDRRQACITCSNFAFVASAAGVLLGDDFGDNGKGNGLTSTFPFESRGNALSFENCLANDPIEGLSRLSTCRPL